MLRRDKNHNDINLSYLIPLKDEVCSLLLNRQPVMCDGHAVNVTRQSVQRNKWMQHQIENI
jgi:hypothetical protein